MSESEVKDKRSIRRYALQLPVTVLTQSGQPVEIVAETHDVSSHGICFYCGVEVPLCSTIEFTLTMPAEVTMSDPIRIHCTGSVVRVEADKAVPGRFKVAAAIDNYDFLADDDALTNHTAYGDAVSEQ